MDKRRICFIAQFPPPIHGLSKAVETLYNSELSKKYDFEKIDITSNKRIIRNLIAIKKSKADLFYFTISQTKGGNLRDLMIFKAIGGRPCLVHLHGGYFRILVDSLRQWQKNKNYKVFSNLAGAIVLGPSLKWIFQGMLPDKKIYIVPNCVDDEYLISDEVFEKKIASFDERKIKHVLYLSNFIKSKGYPEVLEIAKKIKEQSNDHRFHFDFAGKFFDRADEEFFWNYVKDYELQEYVTYHGIVSGDKKRELLEKSDLFVLLTKYPKEGQPISIIEAMANGLVVVTTNHAGIPDIVANDFGIILDKESECLADDAIRAIETADIKMMEIEGREWAKHNFSEMRYISDMERIFSRVLKEQNEEKSFG